MIGVLTSDYDVIVISETWLTEAVLDSEFSLSNYNLFRCDRNYNIRSETRGGGVLILASKKLKSCIIMSENNSVFESIFIKIWFCAKPILINVSYIPPHSKIEDYENLTNFLESAIKNEHNPSKILLFGDFNLPSVIWTNQEKNGHSVLVPDQNTINSQAEILIDFSKCYSLDQINTIKNIKDRTLDLVLTNLSTLQLSCSDHHLVPIDTSHPPLSLILYLDKTQRPNNEQNQSEQEIYNFKKADYIHICKYLESIEWSREFDNLSLNQSVDKFYNFLNHSISLYVPKTKIGLFKFPKWFDSNLKSLMLSKKIAHKKYKESNKISDYALFTSLRSQSNSLAHTLYSKHCKETEEMLRKNPKQFWSFISDKKSTTGFPSVMHLDNKSSDNNQEIANLFAHNFASVYSDQVIVPPEFSYDQFIQLDHKNIRFTESEISLSLSRLKEKAARGVDNISPIFFKKCAPLIAIPLTYMFNRSLQTGIFPEKWKVALITPIFKTGGTRNQIKSYRPVSIISIIPKLFEKLVYDKISNILTPLIISNQYGFMKQRSTQTNLLSFSQYVNSALECGGQVDCIYTDFSKAYDRLNHNILISKLSALGISGYLLEWLRNFHSNRKQIIKVGNTSSEPIHVTSGCIQGGHSSGLLFTLYINDIKQILPNVQYWLFADDLKFALRVRGAEEVNTLQEVLSRLHHWCSLNLMDLNISKCGVMTFHRNKSPILATYNINGQPLIRHGQVRDLGVIFEKDLTFISHIKNIKSKALKMLGFLFRNTKDFSEVATLKALYYAYVRSVLEYCSVVWSPYYNCHIKSLETIQHKFLRMVAFKTKYTIPNHNYSEIESEQNILSLEIRRQINDLLFIHKLFNNKISCPDLLAQINFRDPSKPTRQKQLFYLNRAKTNTGINAPLRRCQHLWNKASDEGMDVFADPPSKILQLF